MSKSLGNFITVHELIQTVDPQVIRFFMATTQYRRPIRYSEMTMKEAATNLQRLRNTFDNVQFRLPTAIGHSEADAHLLVELDQIEQRFIEEMDDDFNSANGITVVYELAEMVEYVLRKERSFCCSIRKRKKLYLHNGYRSLVFYLPPLNYWMKKSNS